MGNIQHFLACYIAFCSNFESNETKCLRSKSVKDRLVSANEIDILSLHLAIGDWDRGSFKEDDAVGLKLSPRSRRVWSVLAPHSVMLSTALRSGQFSSPRQRGRYAVALFSSA